MDIKVGDMVEYCGTNSNFKDVCGIVKRVYLAQDGSGAVELLTDDNVKKQVYARNVRLKNKIYGLFL